MSRLVPTATVLLVAATVGIVLGVSTSPVGRSQFVDARRRATVATGIERAREPQPNDRWNGCNEARAAGTAPIYRGEPGYAQTMDGDDDGVACEPVRS